MDILDKRNFYINGKWVPPLVANEYDVLNPATEEVIARISMGSSDDINAAVSAARAAFPAYSRTPVSERIELLESILDIYKRRYEEMADIITLELGAPASIAKGAQAYVGIGHLKGFLDALKTFEFIEKLPSGDTVYREPIGVCGLITPWNWPVNQIVLKVIPALATGCTMVLKPSELTPLSAFLYTEILEEAGCPAGVFNLVNGDGPVVGAALSRHPDVDMMSFTGSTRAGVAVTRDAAETVKKVTLELGGKSPNLIFADADIEAAVKRGVFTCYRNTGQSCNAPTRMLVERSIYDKVVSMAKVVGEQQAVGNPIEEGHHIGPLISALQYERVQTLINAAQAEGATTLIGGPGKPAGFETGYYVRPTIFSDVNNDMRIAREEVFGPVLTIIPFEDEEDAIRIANDTPYGLAAYIESGDAERVRRVAARLRAGQIHVNGNDCSWGSPFGGYKMSGLGREGGRYGLEDFLEIKAVSQG